MTEIAEAPPSASTAVTVSDDIQSTLARHRGALEYVHEAYPTIESVEVANSCALHLRALKAAEKEVGAAKSELIEPVKAWIEKWIQPTARSIGAAIEHCDTKLLAWTQAEQVRVARERREAEETNRKAKAEAAARAAAEEARAREAAEARRREEAQAEAARAAAAEAGNKREAAKQAALAARLREEAAAREEQGRREAQRIQQEAASRVEPEVRPAEKVSGFHTRKNWKARFAEDVAEDEAIRKIAAAMLGVEKGSDGGYQRATTSARPEFVAMLKVDMSAAGKKAKAEEANFNVPGLEAWNDVGGTSR